MKLILLSLLSFIGLNCFAQDSSRYTLHFVSDGFSLTKTQVKSLDSLLLSLEGPLNSFVYSIQGHTDKTGERDYNVQLSEKRCRSVAQFLVKRGVDPLKLSFEKFAYDIPVASNETETGRANNRRTSLCIVAKFPAPDWNIPAQRFQVKEKEATTVTTKNACKIIIPEDAFLLPEGMKIEGKIELEVLEYNNPAYFIASGIPMSYKAGGKLFMYHSEEMLSVKAFYNGISLELKNDVKLTLNCRAVDSLYVTGFYKFNLKEKKWSEEKKTEPSVTAIIEKKPDKTTPVNVSTPENKLQDIATLPTVDPNTSTNLIEDPFKKPEELTIDTGHYEKVKVDTMYGGYPPKNGDPIAYTCGANCCRAGYFVQLGRKLSQYGLDLSGLDLNGKYSNKRISDPIYLDPTLIETEEQITAKKYYHITVKTKKLFLRKKARISFKFDKQKNPELKALKKVKWTYSFKNNTEDYASFKTRQFHDIRISYDPKRKTANVSLEEKGGMCRITLKTKDPEKTMAEKFMRYQKVITPRIMSIYSCFWAFHKAYFAKADKELTFINWVNYFNSHLGDMRQRYDSLNQNLDAVVKAMHCPCRPRIDSCVFDSVGGDSMVKRLLRGNGPNRMLIIGLGIYNYDQIIPIEDVVTLPSTVFMSSTGRKIQPKESFLLLKGIKGVIHFESTQVPWLIAHKHNTLFIIDQSNRRYKLVFEAGDDLRRLPPVLVLKNITTQTEHLEGLEKELMGK